MMRKTIKSGKTKAEVLNKIAPAPKAKIKGASYSFPVSSRFILNGKLNLVRRAYANDNTDFRLVYCDGNEEIVMLSTLQSEAANDSDFTVTD